MKPAFAPIVVAFMGGVLAILLAAAITGPVLRTYEDGASAWWLALLFAPLLIAALAIGASAWLDNRLNRSETTPPAVGWHVIDDEYEHPGTDPIDKHFYDVAPIILSPLPTAVIPKQRNTDGLS